MIKPPLTGFRASLTDTLVNVEHVSAETLCPPFDGMGRTDWGSLPDHQP